MLNDEVVVTFKDAPYSLNTNHTCKQLGQFYQIYLSKL